MDQAREHAVAHGPIFVEAITYRYYHQNGPLPGSAFKYRSKDEEREWKGRDPAVAWPRGLIEAGLLSADDVQPVMAALDRVRPDSERQTQAPFFEKQVRVATENFGKVDPEDLEALAAASVELPGSLSVSLVDPAGGSAAVDRTTSLAT